MTDGSGDGTIARAIRSYFTEFGRLQERGRDFWVVQWVNLLDGVAYFSMLTVSTLYLSETLGYSDSRAAVIWAGCMAVYTAVGFVSGFIGDSLGIKRTLHLSVVILVFARLVVSFTTKAIVVPALFVISLGTAIMTPILISATKRFTTKKSQSAGFSMLYLLMNIGAFLGNFIIDPLRRLEMGNRSIFLVGSAMSILCWISILVFMRRRIGHADRNHRIEKNGGEEVAPSGEKEKWEAPWTIAASVFRETAFWRFMLFLVLLVGVRLVFEHQYQIYPKYYQRTMSELAFTVPVDTADGLDDERIPAALLSAFEGQGRAVAPDSIVGVEQPGLRWRIVSGLDTYLVAVRDGVLKVYSANVPVGKLNSINPFIICFGVILSTPIVARFKLFNVMYFGIVVSALSMVVLCIYPGWFTGALGMTLAQGYLLIALVQIVLFSFGEVIWSPRLYEYTASVAPTGREASYMGLSYTPMFFARFAEGPLAGGMLDTYCPPDVTDRLTTVPYLQSPQFMCVILAGLAISSPILILLFRGVIQRESAKDL